MPHENIILEVCLDSIASAIAVQNGGAHRVEVCSTLTEGGTTPSAGTIELIRKNITIGLHVLIRPRTGDFCYSEIEFEVMKQDITVAKRLGANGVVFGLLNEDGSVDTIRTRMLVDLARPMEVTFHRAFDVAKNPLHAFEDIMNAGVDRLLTSGQHPTAIEGISLIAELVARSRGCITVMPGCGIQESNVEEILVKTGAKEIHVGRAVHNHGGSNASNSDFIFGAHKVVDAKKVESILKTYQT